MTHCKETAHGESEQKNRSIRHLSCQKSVERHAKRNEASRASRVGAGCPPIHAAAVSSFQVPKDGVGQPSMGSAAPSNAIRTAAVKTPSVCSDCSVSALTSVFGVATASGERTDSCNPEDVTETPGSVPEEACTTSSSSSTMPSGGSMALPGGTRHGVSSEVLDSCVERAWR